MRKRKYSDITSSESGTAIATATGKTYGIVTDAQKWYILECTTDSGGLSFLMSRLPSQVIYGGGDWEKQVEAVLGCLVWGGDQGLSLRRHNLHVGVVSHHRLDSLNGGNYLSPKKCWCTGPWYFLG